MQSANNSVAVGMNKKKIITKYLKKTFSANHHSFYMTKNKDSITKIDRPRTIKHS